MTVAIAPPFALELVARRWRRRGGEADLSVGAPRSWSAPSRSGRASSKASPRCSSRSVCAPTRCVPTYGLAEATLAVTAKPLGTPLPHGRRRSPPLGVVRARRSRTCRSGSTPRRVSCSTRTPGGDGRLPRRPRGDRQRSFDGDWLRTGDVAQIVDDEVVIVGRLKEMINRNGQRIAASDFELAVQGTEGVLPDRVVAFGDRRRRRANASCCWPSPATAARRPARSCSRSGPGSPTPAYPRTSWSWSRPASSPARRAASSVAAPRVNAGTPPPARPRRSAPPKRGAGASRRAMNGDHAIAADHEPVHDVHREPQRAHDVEEEHHPLAVGVVPHLVLVGVVEDAGSHLLPT